ncbi:preprotein translocase subunit SecY [Synoicihabitans lomoniglobus]|uniref:Protein translocase subunit SecY n=1 Tax=Synoicihabitans lomoniglobus TaxID=2909285 RepID=A0AAE9ZYW0_9BACT|nr:preprotein translocase subunit SecY [Opitutaceae bacterium LMO-M01]WED65635.1 preprotein translocase subunit SecY [Opitutaceae bacterium LMO-M01]
MLSAFTNSLKIPELRQRIFYTLSLLFIARVAAVVPLPGLDPAPLKQFFADQTAAGSGALVGMMNMFTGGALTQGAIGALGIMPYISASIIFQLMTAVVPALSRLQQEGDVGRQKLTQYTRYATVLICLVQGTLLILALENPARLFGSSFDVNTYGDIVIVSKAWFLVTSVIIMTAGTMLLMWLGEQITQRGIGNGVSLLITVGILADIPGAAQATYQLFFAPVGVQTLGLPQGIIMFGLFILVTMGIIMVVQGQRKIPVQYAKRVVGNKVMGGQSSFMPLKVNYSGVMPVIFASAILMFPQQILSQLGAALELDFLVDFSNNLLRGHWMYYAGFGFLILFFSYFWVSVMFKPIQIADDLKKYGGYIPGVRPGQPTAKFLDFIMTRLTLAGAIFLTIIAVLPDVLLFELNVPQRIAIFFGGTGMLITVGVVLDTMKQIETFLLQRHYDGFLKKGRVRARSNSASRPGSLGDAASADAVFKLTAFMGGMLLFGLAIWLWRQFGG